MHIEPPQHPLRRKAAKAAIMASLRLQNQIDRRSILGDAPVAVSLTSYGHRIETVSFAIESVARGSVRPRRFVLWVEEADLPLTERADLQRLSHRGLEIRTASNYGPHTKNYPYARDHADDGLSMVTCDDDILYPRGWLAGLVRARAARPEHFLAYRAHEVTLDADGLAPYASWPPATGATLSERVFVTGVGGTVFPPRLMRHMRDAGEAFMDTCPKADDLWISLVALRTGVPTAVVPNALKALVVPRVQQKGSLHEGNVHGGNDAQIQATYTDEDIELVRAAGAP